MAGGGESDRSFEYTPTWVVAVVCFVIVFISLCAARGLHKLGKYFKRKNQEALFEALQKVKEELMLLGFISLLLTVFQGVISNICMPEDLANIMLPCKLKTSQHQTPTHGRRLLAEEVSEHCSEGHVPFLSLEALHQLHIFIFVLAVVYVTFCAATMVLGGIKLLLIVGAKLEHVITELAKDAAERPGDAEGSRVRPSDELFWFHRPALVLYLIHFILFQNSFEIAFFFFASFAVQTTYGFRSCIMEELGFIIPRLVVGVIVQVLCSYSTLPLYALVTQMGSMFKQTVFDEFTHGLLMTWAKDRKPGSSISNGDMSRLTTESIDPISLAQQPVIDGEITLSEIQFSCPNNSHMPPS